MTRQPRCLVAMLCITATLAACQSGDETRQTSPAPASVASETDDKGACALLTRDQVNTVLPEHDGGQVRDASEATLLKDVTMDVCRYMHVTGTNVEFLMLIVYRASSDESFQQIEIGHWGNDQANRKLDIGDLGFLVDRSTQDEMIVTASVGRTVFELKLNSHDALAKSDPLVALARIIGGAL